MTGYRNESERMANGANQSANGGRWPLDRVSGEVAARPIRGGRRGRAATREPDRAAQATAGERLRSPRLARRLTKRGHHYDRIIGLYLETVTGHGHLFIRLRCMPTVHSWDISRTRKSTRNRRPSADQRPN